MLAFLNQVRKPTLDLPLEAAAQNVVQTVHAVVSGGFHRLSDHVPDPQKL
ncbi:Hexose phosphate transport protein UhpT [Klebsiella oxytoca]|nr:Hexose phosphate transport protein UhpT [Klebsiella oxytoca]